MITEAFCVDLISALNKQSQMLSDIAEALTNQQTNKNRSGLVSCRTCYRFFSCVKTEDGSKYCDNYKQACCEYCQKPGVRLTLKSRVCYDCFIKARCNMENLGVIEDMWIKAISEEP